MVNRIDVGQMTSSSAEKGKARVSIYRASVPSDTLVVHHSGNVDELNTRRSTKRRNRKQIKKGPKSKRGAELLS